MVSLGRRLFLVGNVALLVVVPVRAMIARISLVVLLVVHVDNQHSSLLDLETPMEVLLQF